MTRLIAGLVLVLAVTAVPVFARAEQGSATTQAKTIEVAGTVTAVTTDSLTVKGKTETWTFSIDKDTTVTVKGATHKTLELKAEGKASKLTDFVKVADYVTVSYHDKGATKHAARIRVTASVK
jgi:hypothetical protein